MASMNPILIAVLPALAALAGVAITAVVSHITQRSARENALQIERLRIDEAQGENAHNRELTALADVHKSLSRVARDCSKSRLVALLDARTTLQAYDPLYFQACTEFDSARFLVAVHVPSLVKDVEAIYSQMNIFWGNARGALIDQASGTPMATSGSFAKACGAADDVNALCRGAKNLLLVQVTL